MKESVLTTLQNKSKERHAALYKLAQQRKGYRRWFKEEEKEFLKKEELIKQTAEKLKL